MSGRFGGFEPIVEVCRHIALGRGTLASCVPGAVSLGGLSLAACGGVESEPPAAVELGASARALQLDPGFEPDSPSSRAAPAADYTSFEADPVRPLAILASNGLIAIANTSDDFLDLVRPTGRGVRACGAIKVGMRPVAVAVVHDSPQRAELWVVNHLSDSVSIVSIDPSACTGEVIETLYTGDEPRDIVVAPTRAGCQRVFVASAHRGQHHPLAGARLGTDLV